MRLSVTFPSIAGAAIVAALTTGVAVAPAGEAPTARSASTRTAAQRPLAAPAAPSDPAVVPTSAAARHADDAKAVTPLPIAPAVALDPALARPQAGDTAATRAARRRLGLADDAYQLANQLYDRARADAVLAVAALTSARAAAAQAVARARRAHAVFVVIVTAQFEGGNAPLEARLLTAHSPADVLAQSQMEQIVATRTADVLAGARQAEAAAQAARRRVAQAQAAAQAAARAADAQLVAAADALRSAQRAVADLHTKDLVEAAVSRADTLTAAAAAIEAEALAGKAADARDFAAATGPAQVIAVAVRAVLEQAARSGRRSRIATPDLGGTVPYTGQTGTGPVLALTRFDGTVSGSGWPNAGVGTKVAGTAPFLKPGHAGVHPKLPPYRKGYRPLRAELAVDAALAKLGSPYVWDAAGPDTFDCSGLTLWAWGHAGVALEHYTGAQVHQGRLVAADALLPGDLLLFGPSLHHVGMYLGAGYMIDAPTTGDYVKVQAVSDNGDFAVAVRP